MVGMSADRLLVVLLVSGEGSHGGDGGGRGVGLVQRERM